MPKNANTPAEEAEHAAALLKAAPAMLRALREIFAVTERAAQRNIRGSLSLRDGADIRNAARDALAKLGTH